MSSATARRRTLARRLEAYHRRFLGQAVLDCMAWALALTLAALFRYDFRVDAVSLPGLFTVIPLAALGQMVTGVVLGLYVGRWRVGSFEEVAAVARAVAMTTLVLFGLGLIVHDAGLMPRSVPATAGVIALVVMAGTRYSWRLAAERRRRPSGEGCERLLVFGAGDGGAQIVAAMLQDPKSQYLPVALFDDDAVKRKLRVKGVPVVGGREALVESAGALGADALLIAIPSAGAALVSELTELGTHAGLTVKVLPPVGQLLAGNVHVRDIRKVTDADLLGRRAISTDVEAIAGYLAGRRVLVTGAGGSIGSELCRQISGFAPAELIMVDCDDSELHALQLALDGKAMLDSPDLILLDLRDSAAVDRLLAARRPEVVFHAAALKHVTLLERFPAEGFKTNVEATLGLLEAATASGVERFVNISTDKAAAPCSVLGYTKRLSERLTAYFALASGRNYLSVRFGNVLGSRGSVLTAFHSQLDRGEPLTVTHPEVSRFFMTVEEAVQLVIQAGAIGRPGEALVLDMGKSVRIAAVARLLAERADPPATIEFTGLRPGEKLHETLFGPDEVGRPRAHPLISHVDVPPVNPTATRSLALAGDSDDLVRRLAELYRAAPTRPERSQGTNGAGQGNGAGQHRGPARAAAGDEVARTTP